jgi:maleate isomerase
VRRRIGVMIPSTNTTVEADFGLAAGGAFTVHGQRLWLAADGPADFERMNREAESGAKYLGTAKVDVVAYGCVMGSVTGGPAADKAMLAMIEREAHAPAVAVMPASLEALRSFGAKRISVATPYGESTNKTLKAYLEGQGFEVLSIAGEPRAAAAGAQGVNDQPPESVEKFASQACAPEADALFCACTAWRSLEVAEKIEKKIGKPVVTANGALLWATLRAVGEKQPVRGYGRLLEKLS